MRKITFFSFVAIATVAVAQGFPNMNSEDFGAVKYTIAADSYNYSHGAIMDLYFDITNITDTTVFFECPSLNLSVHRVTLRGVEIDFFPATTLPAILSVTLHPNESRAETLSWDTSPTTEDTIYKLWGILNVAPSWSPMPRESLYVEFNMGAVNVQEEIIGQKSTWFLPNPIRGSVHIDGSGEYEIYNLVGKRIGEFRAPAIVDFAGYSPGVYFINRTDTGECKKLLILK